MKFDAAIIALGAAAASSSPAAGQTLDSSAANQTLDIQEEPVGTLTVTERQLSGRVTFKMKEALAGPSGTDGLVAPMGANVVMADDALGIQVVEVPGGAGGEQDYINQFVELFGDDAIDFIEIDYLESPSIVPNDPGMFFSWHHTNAKMQTWEAWDLHTGGPSVTVAICDTGLQADHPDLAGNKVEGYNAVTRLRESQGGDISPVNGNSHGTRCAGCAAAIGNNGVGVAGMGWNFRHRPIQVSTPALGGNAYSSTLAHCARWACDRGDIASVSYGGVEASSRRAAATYCKSKGRLMFNAAGNDGRNIAGYNADADDLIVVGATDSNDNRAGFSAYGSFVDVMAPGASVVTTTTGSSYVLTSGTSFSCPFTAGLAALIWSRKPALTPDQVETVIKESATDLGAAGKDTIFAHGRINALGAMQHRLVAGVSCMSGETRVTQSAEEFKYVHHLAPGDEIQGLDENKERATCTVEAVGHFGTGPVYGNYTEDHFILDASSDSVSSHGPVGTMEVVDKYAVLTSCPVGLDETGVGFTPVDADFLGDEPMSWSDYVLIHRAIVDIVREVGPFVFSPSTYTSLDKVKQYTKVFHKTMLQCAKNPRKCHAFEKAALELLENSLTEEAKEKVKSGFRGFGSSTRQGSISDAVTRGRSVRRE